MHDASSRALVPEPTTNFAADYLSCIANSWAEQQPHMNTFAYAIMQVASDPPLPKSFHNLLETRPPGVSPVL